MQTVWSDLARDPHLGPGWTKFLQTLSINLVSFVALATHAGCRSILLGLLITHVVFSMALLVQLRLIYWRWVLCRRHRNLRHDIGKIVSWILGPRKVRSDTQYFPRLETNPSIGQFALARGVFPSTATTCSSDNHR
jgi:hypothetical protein